MATSKRAPRTSKQAPKNEAPASTEQTTQTAPQTETAPEAAPRTIGFAIVKAARPSAGERLFAHTAVFMEHTGMLTGKAVPSATVAKVMGRRAIKWHTDAGSLEATPEGIKLTEAGKVKFAGRTINPELKAAFEAVLIDGKADERAIKNAAFIKPLADAQATE